MYNFIHKFSYFDHIFDFDIYVDKYTDINVYVHLYIYNTHIYIFTFI